MAVFVYSAANQGGTVSKGEREAESQKALAQALRGEGLFLLEAAEKGARHSLVRVDVGQLAARIRPVRLVEKMVFARNLSVMIGAGLSLTKGLDALASQMTNPKFRKVIQSLNEAVIKGNSFAQALRGHPAVFGDLFTNMVEAGETSGKLTLVLRLLANQMKKDYELRRRLKGALIYPAIILVALVGIGVLMMVYVVPTLVQTIQELNVELPASTRAIIFISNSLVRYALLTVFLVLGIIILFWRVLRTQAGQRIWDGLILRLPIIGHLVQDFNTARFCRTLSYLLTSGVPIIRSLEITAAVLGNHWYRHVVEKSAAEIQKGTQLHTILAEHPRLFQPVVLQMVAVGEETGKISTMLLRLAFFFEENVSATTKNFSTIIEPVLMIFIGLVVGLFAVSMLQPIYSSLGSI